MTLTGILSRTITGWCHNSRSENIALKTRDKSKSSGSSEVAEVYRGQWSLELSQSLTIYMKKLF